MKQIIQNYKTGELQILDVPLPMLKTGGILVENHFSLISSGTESSTIDVSRKGIVGKAKEKPEQLQQVMGLIKTKGLLETYRIVKDRLELPVPMGYSCAGIVREVSNDVNEFRIGDRVSCAVTVA